MKAWWRKNACASAHKTHIFLPSNQEWESFVPLVFVGAGLGPAHFILSLQGKARGSPIFIPPISGFRNGRSGEGGVVMRPHLQLPHTCPGGQCQGRCRPQSTLAVSRCMSTGTITLHPLGRGLQGAFLGDRAARPRGVMCCTRAFSIRSLHQMGSSAAEVGSWVCNPVSIRWVRGLQPHSGHPGLPGRNMPGGHHPAGKPVA